MNIHTMENTTRKGDSSGRRVILAIAMTIACTNSTPASAESWRGPFKSPGLFVSAHNNGHYRIDSPIPLCDGGHNWAYVDENDSGAKGKMAAILAAILANRDLYVMADSLPPTGHCHVSELQVR